MSSTPSSSVPTVAIAAVTGAGAASDDMPDLEDKPVAAAAEGHGHGHGGHHGGHAHHAHHDHHDHHGHHEHGHREHGHHGHGHEHAAGGEHHGHSHGGGHAGHHGEHAHGGHGDHSHGRHEHGHGGHDHAGHSHGGGGAASGGAHGHSHGGGASAAALSAEDEKALAAMSVSEREAAGRARFTKMAADYDSQPGAPLFKAKCLEAISTLLPPLNPSTTDFMDFACGPGHTGLSVSERVRSVLCVDSAPGMIEVVKLRAAERKVTNVTGACIMLSESNIAELPRDAATGAARKFDVIFSSMAFHHIADPSAYLKIFASLLKPTGVVCLLDMLSGAASSSALGAGTKAGYTDIFHHGFEMKSLETLANAAGLAAHHVAAPFFVAEMRGHSVPIFAFVAKLASATATATAPATATATATPAPTPASA